MKYTYRNGKRINLRINDRQVIARLTPEIVESLGYHVESDLSPSSVAVAAQKHEHTKILADLQSHGAAFPFYEDDENGAPFLITDRIIVTLSELIDAEVLQTILTDFSLELVSQLSDTEYVLRLTAASDKDPVNVVVALHESKLKGVQAVEHDLNYLVQTFDQHRHADPDPSDPQYQRQWHLHTHSTHPHVDPRSSSNCDKAWELLGSYGSADVVIGMTDDGCRLDHKDFDDGKFAGWGYMRGARLVTHRDIGADPARMYQNGANHGTSCCGVIAAEVDASLTVGAAPGCSLLPIKWESNGPFLSISDSKFLTVLNFVNDRIDILSNSWGSVPISIWSSNVRNRIAQMAVTGGRRGKGILFLWAAGNNNCPINYVANVDVPYTNGWRREFGQRTWVGVNTANRFRNNLADSDGVLHIAALASTAQRSHYSCYGPGVDLCAPSNNIHHYQRLPVDGLGITTTTGENSAVTHSFGGTSSATPLVAGIAGLMISANDALTAEEIREILKSTASQDLNFTGYKKTPPTPYDNDTSWDISPIKPFDKGDFNQDGWSPWFGFGKVDAATAVRQALDGEEGRSDEEVLVEHDAILSELTAVVSQYDDGLEENSAFAVSEPLLFPANGNAVTYTITLRYPDGRPAPGERVTAEVRPVTLTGAGWRQIGPLSARWPARSGDTLRERHRQGLVRLTATLDRTATNTDAEGRATFTVRAWHVCGNDSRPATDEILFRSAAGTDRSRVRCGVDGLVPITNDARRGVVTSTRARGRFVHSQVNSVLEAIGQAWVRVTGKPPGMPNHITITDGSLRWGGLTPPHLSHRFGGAVDVRPMSTDGQATTVGAGNYSRDGTRIIIDFMRQTGATRIIFGEQLPGVTDVRADHRNHIHVSWLQDPREPWLVVTSLNRQFDSSHFVSTVSLSKTRRKSKRRA